MEAPYDYMKRMLAMFDEFKSEAPTVEDVIKHPEIVIELGENVQKSPVFEKNRAEFDSYCQAIETQIEDRKERLAAAWGNFIERFANCENPKDIPQMVIMNMPAVSKYLLEYRANPEPLKKKR